MSSIFVELGIILIVATFLGLFFRTIKQPLILAYLVSGILLSQVYQGKFSTDIFTALSQVGVAFLLFIVGLNMDVRVFKEVGRTSFIVGITQVFLTTLAGYYLLLWLGFPPLAAFYSSVALSFSSTIIIIKLLADKNDLEALYGKVAVGILLLQDLIAIILLIIIPVTTTKQVPLASLLLVIVKGAILFLLAFLFQRFFKKYFDNLARSQELIFLSAIAWCFFMAMIAQWFSLSIEIGSFLAGITLASLPFNLEITSKIKPLRDFFLILFFVVLGMQLQLSNVQHLFIPALFLSLFVILIKPLITIIFMGVMGYKSRTGFLTGLSIAQISEFSLIIIALAVSLNYFPAEVLTLITLVGVITIAISAYLITFGEKIYDKLAPVLHIFERKHVYENELTLHSKEKQYNIILIGYHRIGYNVLKKLQEQRFKFLVVDYNPAVIRSLMEKNIPCIYGDVSDDEMLQQLKKYRPKVIISTIHLLEDNILVTQTFRKADKNVVIYATGKTVQEALLLYKKGANYVIVPHLLGGERVADLLKHALGDKRKLHKIKTKHIEDLLTIDLPQKV